MNESNLKRMIRAHKEHAIWIAVFLFLAVFVTALTFGTLKRSVQAQTYTKRVFACSYAQEGAEPVAHQHNDDCYENGELICTLPERELHVHGDECYTEEKVLVCTMEEGEGHVHTDACYTEKPVLICTLEENDGHVHSAENGCYTRVQGDLICTDEDPEHVHTDDCYTWEEILTCEIPEGEGAHHHSEECYETQRVLSCGKEEGEGAHTHDDTCYEINKVLICDKEEVKTEHVHTVDCFQVVDMSPEEIHALHMSELPESDPTADVESPDVWESRFASVPLSGHWDRDLLKIAETQLGYTESQRNFDAVLDENGEGYTLKGWTRYGAWYGIPYGDWCAMFVSFCLNYADIPESAVPYDCATTTWIESLSERDMYAPAAEYDPKPGDLIFFDWEGDGLSDHVGLVWAVNPDSITTIEGNHTIAVELFDYDRYDSHIQGYGILPEKPAEEVSSGDDASDEASGEASIGGDSAVSANGETAGVAESDKKEPLDPETLAKMPPFSYTERVAGMRVTIEADAGAFPEGTTVTITPIEDKDFTEEVSSVLSGEVIKIQAVDITFYDAEGEEIEPQIPIRVTMRPFDQDAEASVEVIHVADDGTISSVKPNDSIAQPDKGAAFESDSFSQYLLVQYLNNNKQESRTLSFPSPGQRRLGDILKELYFYEGVLDDDPVLQPVDTSMQSGDAVLSLKKIDNSNEWILESSGEFTGSYLLQAKFWNTMHEITLTGVAKESQTTTVKFFSQDAVIYRADQDPGHPYIHIVGDQKAPELTKQYYLLAVLKDSVGHDLGWSIEPVSLNGNATTQVDFDSFHEFETRTDGESEADYEARKGSSVDGPLLSYSAASNTISTRLYRTDNSIYPLTYNGLVVKHYENATDLPEDGYEYGGNFYPAENQNEIDIKESTPKDYTVRINLGDLTETIDSNEKYYVFATIDHANSVSYRYDPLVITDADLTKGYKEYKFDYWVDQNGNQIQNSHFTGNEKSIDVKLLKYNDENGNFGVNEALTAGKVTVYENDVQLKGCNVNYNTKLTNPKDTITGYEETVDNSGVIHCVDNVYLSKGTEKDYVVRINLLQGAEGTRALIGEDENYYVFLTITDENKTYYQYERISVTQEDLDAGYVDIPFEKWRDENGKVIQNSSFSGNESIDAKLVYYYNPGNPTEELKPNNLNKAVIYSEGNTIKSYSVSYVLKADHPDSEYVEEPDSEAGVVHYIDTIKLTTFGAESDYTYASILGPNMLYGIVADHLFHANHLQTTFAVNHYTGHDQGVRPDLSGTSAGSIVIAEFNQQDDNNPQGNYVGTTVTDNISTGQLKVEGADLNGTLVVYVDRNSGARFQADTGETVLNNVTGDLNHTVVISSDGQSLSSSIVQPAIDYGIAMSKTLAGKTATLVLPDLPSDANSLILDTSAFDEYATIYVDADNIKGILANTNGLTINKRDNQTIVFNFKTESYNELTLGSFTVIQPNLQDSNPNGFPTHSPQGKGDKDNEIMDDIARHIVWNLNGIKGRTTINTSGGIFLQPNKGSDIFIGGTTAGWIVSNGFVANGDAEWHHVFADMPNSDTVKLRALKTVDGGQPCSSQIFTFYLDEYVSPDSWNEKFREAENSSGSIDFSVIPFDTSDEGWHFYRIREVDKASSTEGSYLMDRASYYAAVYVHVINEHVVAVPPIYYSELNPALFESSTVYPAENRLVMPVFENKTKTDNGSVQVTKAFAGINEGQIPTAFQITATWGPEGKQQTRKLMISGMDNYQDVVMTKSENELTYTWTISNLPVGETVSFVESGFSIDEMTVETTANGTANATSATAAAVENFTSADGKAAFTNTYTATTQLDLHVRKVIHGTETGIAGAQFVMRTLEPKGNGNYNAAEVSEYQSAPQTSGPDGNLTFENVQDGYYEVYELTIPDGYIRTGDSTFYIHVDKGNVTWLEKGSGPIAEWGVKTQDDTNTVTYTPETSTFAVGNVPGTELPNSGGPGTALYSLLGGLIVITAGAVLTLLRKKNKA